jgi:hypothetical protein
MKHRIPFDIHGAQNALDPGNAGTITVNRSPHVVALVSAAAETRTLAIPTSALARCKLYMKTDGGDITLTVTGGYNEAGDTTFVFSEVGQFAIFEAIDVSGTLTWRMTSSHIQSDLSSLDATVTELDRVADMSTRVVDCTASSLAVTEALHDGKIITLNRAAGIAVTLPVPAAGMRFEFIVQTTFTGASTIKSVAGTHIMIGHALLGNDTDNSVVLWQALAASTFDTINLYGTANSTGGIAGQRIVITGLSATVWHVEITGDAAGTEATPFENTVA